MEARQRKDLEAIERHASTKISPWSEGAHVEPAVIAEPPRRHRKPQDAGETNGIGYTKLIANTGRAGGLEPSELIAAVAAGGGLDGADIRNVRVLERFALVEVPAADARRIVAAVNGTTVHGRRLALEPVRGS